jgi:alkanesulfonate monooxygenase SsuD/methylene tetrahydromethanopterin reductase-like flavin-dependent oxidoreductase (luciferase family)
LKFGILLPVEGNVTDGNPNAELAIRAAETSEELGYDSVWAGERLLLSQRFDPISILGAVAARTNRVRIGTAVLIAPLRPPVILADQLASLDNISNGRLIAGFGVGADRIKVEYESVGVPFLERGGRLDECIQILNQLWTGRSVSFNGKYHELNNVQMKLKPKQKNGPPIFLGGTKKISLKRIAKYANGWLPLEVPPKDYENLSKQIKSYNPAKSIEKALYLTLNIGPDRKLAKEEAHRFLETYYNVKFPSIEKIAFCGTIADCIGRLEEYSSVGVETVVVRFASFRDQVAELESFKEQVASRF